MDSRRAPGRIGLPWLFSPLLAVALLHSIEVRAEGVAVMPVRGLNVSQGECDAIGELFARALGRETRVEVISPARTGPVLAQGKSSAAAVAELAAAAYIELEAVRLEAKVMLGGIRFDKDGVEIFRAETAVPSLDQMDVGIAQLAHALAWRQPIRRVPVAAQVAKPGEAPAPAPARYPKALGIKLGLGQPMAAGRTFAPIVLGAFDARFGTRDYFWELAGGAALATESSSQTGKAGLQGLFVEVGLNAYLADGSIAPYAGGGLSPRFWAIDNSAANDGIKCAVYGQLGVTFTRDARARFYSELRVSQNIIGIPEDDFSAPVGSPP